MNFDRLLVVITPATVLSVFLAGLFLGWFVWSVSHRRAPAPVFHFANWVAGVAFLVLLYTARVADGAEAPEKWLGAVFLWTEYVLVGGAVVLIAVRIRRRRSGL